MTQRRRELLVERATLEAETKAIRADATHYARKWREELLANTPDWLRGEAARYADLKTLEISGGVALNAEEERELLRLRALLYDDETPQGET